MKIRASLAAFAVAAALAWLVSPAAALPGLAGPALAVSADSADVSVVALRAWVAADAADSRREPFRFEITNNGPSTAMDLVIEIDYQRADPARVTFIPPTGGGCGTASKKLTCRLEPLVGRDTMEFTLPVHGRGTLGPAGTLAVTVKSTTADPRQDNNSVQLPLEVGSPRFDLVAVASDVYGDKAKPPSQMRPVPVGGTATLNWFLVNATDRARKGVVYSIQLPEHVTFAGQVGGCEYTPDNRTMTCADPAAVVGPQLANAYYLGGTRVVVAADAPGQVLVGGTVTGFAREEVAGGSDGSGPNVTALTDGQRELVAEILPDETVAQYGVHVGSVDNEDSGFLAALRIGRLSSGLSIALISTVGLVVLGAGAAMFLVSRRRRVILVAPDESPPA